MQVLQMISILVLCQLLGASETSLQITQNENVSISSDKDSYENMEPMKLTISCINKGFVTILYQAENGYSSIVKENAVCDRVYNFPDEEELFGFTAENHTDHQINERFKVLYSTKKIDKNTLLKSNIDSSSITITVQGKNND